MTIFYSTRNPPNSFHQKNKQKFMERNQLVGKSNNRIGNYLDGTCLHENYPRGNYSGTLTEYLYSKFQKIPTETVEVNSACIKLQA